MDVGYNGNRFYKTPEIDKLPKEWMRFKNSYMPSPMYSPTKTSICTRPPKFFGMNRVSDIIPM